MSVPKPRTGQIKIRHLGFQSSLQKVIDNLPEPRAPKAVCNCDCHLTTPHDNPHPRHRCHCKPPNINNVS